MLVISVCKCSNQTQYSLTNMHIDQHINTHVAYGTNTSVHHVVHHVSCSHIHNVKAVPFMISSCVLQCVRCEYLLSLSIYSTAVSESTVL